MPLRLPSCRIATVLGLTIPLWSYLPTAAGTAVALDTKTYRLSNGLEVILHVDHRLPMVVVEVSYRAGALNEPANQPGMAHLFEHLMSESSEHVKKGQQISIVQSIGGVQDATTSFDRTRFFMAAPENHLETLLWLQSDRMGFLTISRDALERQKQVVKNEIHQRIDNRGYGVADQRIIETLFSAPHPYRSNVLGSIADIEQVDESDARRFFEAYYAPSNATLTIVGDFNSEATYNLVQKYFSTLRNVAPPAVIAQEQPPPREERHLSLVDNVRLGRLTMAWIAGTAYGPTEPAVDLLAS